MSEMRKYRMLTSFIRRFRRWWTARRVMRIVVGGGCDYDAYAAAAKWLVTWQVRINDGRDFLIVFVDSDGIEARELLNEHDPRSALPPKRIAWADIKTIYVY